jgi:hypothetical protein
MINEIEILEVKCIDCGRKRKIYPQHADRVVRCLDCQLRHDKDRRNAAQKEKRRIIKELKSK